MDWPKIVFVGATGAQQPQLACSSECQEKHACLEVNFFPGVGGFHIYSRLRVCCALAHEQTARGVADVLSGQQRISVPAEVADAVRYQLTKAGY